MSYTFRVIFDGVLAYVPDKPFFVPCTEKASPPCSITECCLIDGQRPKICYKCDQPESKEIEVCWKRRDDHICHNEPGSGPVRSLAVLVPDLRRPEIPKTPKAWYGSPPENHGVDGEGRRRNFPKFRDAHFPLLRFRLGDLRSGTTRGVDLVSRDISQQDEYGNLFLRREQIRFKMESENAKLFTYSGWAPCPLPPRDKLPREFQGGIINPFAETIYMPDWWGALPDLSDREQLESLWWLPDLARIVSNDDLTHQVKPEFLPSYRGPFPQDLVARIECSGGHLRTYDFNRDVDGNPVKWSFAPPGNSENPTWNRALANSLALEFFDVRDEVRIELKRLANEVVVEELVLAPGPGASRPVVEIEITNREPDLLFQEESFNRSALPDMDFQPFYQYLSRTKRPVEDLPVPFPHQDSFFGVVEKPCAGSGMTAASPTVRTLKG